MNTMYDEFEEKLKHKLGLLGFGMSYDRTDFIGWIISNGERYTKYVLIDDFDKRSNGELKTTLDIESFAYVFMGHDG